MKKKTVAILMAAAMIFSGAVGATAAWLTAQATEIVNTFTYGDINLELTEEKPEGRTGQMIPGSTIEKDPAVVVKAGSEACWVFVKIETENHPDQYLTYTVNSVWKPVPGQENVYYLEQGSLAELSGTENNKTYPVLAGNQVTVKENITKTQLTDIGTNYPKLKFIAYAVQKENIPTVEAAWAKVPVKSSTP